MLNINWGFLLIQIFNILTVLIIPITIILVAIWINRRFRSLEDQIKEIEKAIKEE
jgi:flagellar biogenesis protein FliO